MADVTLKLTDFFQGTQKTPIPFPPVYQHGHLIRAIKVCKARKQDPDELEYFRLILPPDPEKSHSCPLFRKYGAKHFLQLLFYKDCPEKVVKLLVENGITTCTGSTKQVFRFFGHSATQLRNRACILYDSGKVSYDDVISSFGSFPSDNVAKRAARIGLLLSESQVAMVLQEEQIRHIDDVTSGRFNFTDGCGFVSLAVAKQVAESLNQNFGESYSGREFPVPSVFQVRVKGCKGVLMLTTDERWKDCIVIRPSMEKFQWKVPAPHPLGVCDGGRAVSFPNHFGALNKQFIRLLSGLGVPDHVFLEKQERFFQDLLSIGSNQNIQVRFLCAYGHFYEAEKILYSGTVDEDVLGAIRKIQRKLLMLPGKGQFKNFSSRMAEIREMRKKDFRRLRIPVEKSRIVFGVADPSGKLEYGSCFFQPTVNKEKPTVLEGRSVIVAKSPAYHPGDIRVLTCRNVPELHHLIDCIVFPVTGKRPHADELSGGDLDGDTFAVFWDEDLLQSLKPIPPTSYEGAVAEIPRSSVKYSDLVEYFIEYDTLMPRKLDDLYSAWADAKGVMSHECQFIANIFNIAIDSAKTGKEININLGMPPSHLKKRTFVWEKMMRNAENFKQSNCLASSLRPSSDGASFVHLLNEDDVCSLLESEENRIPEFNLFRLIYKWREHRDTLQSSDGRSLFHHLMTKINFSRFTDVQRKLALVDLQPLGADFGHLVMNALYGSKILSTSDVVQLEKGFGLKEYNWVRYCWMEGSQISWKLVNDAMQMPNLKLVLLKLVVSDKKEMVIGVGVHGRLILHETVRVNSSGGVGAAVFVSDHNMEDGNASSAFAPLGDEYEIALDGERLQLYESSRAERADTFVCLLNSQDDDSMRLSVALNKFQRTGRTFYANHQRTRIKTAHLMHVEIFINTPRPMIAPAIWFSREPKRGPTSSDGEPATPVVPANLGSQQTTSSGFNFAEFGKKYLKLEERVKKGETMIYDLREWLQAVTRAPEVHLEEAKYWEDLLSKSPGDASLLDADEFFLLLKLLLQTSAPLASIKRLLEVMAKVKQRFSWKHLKDLINHVIFCCEDRKLSIKFLDFIHSAGNFPLTPSDFYSFEVMQYFLHWLPMVTIEFLHDVMETEKASPNKEIVGWPFLKSFECADRIFHKVKLNIEGSDQVFRRENGLMFSSQLHRTVFFAEIVEVEGIILTIRIVWPEHQAGIDQLQQLLDRQDSESDKFHIRAFPNLVTYRVQVETLKAACIRNYVEPQPSRIVHEITKSFWGHLVKVKDLQMAESSKNLHDLLQPVCSGNLENSSSGGGGAERKEEPSEHEPGEDLSDLERDEPEPEKDFLHPANISRFRGEIPLRKKVAFDLSQITYNIPSWRNLPPRLEQVEQRKRRALSSGRIQRIDLSDPVNDSQKDAIVEAVEKNLTVIQGPPGTGKTRVAAIIVREWLKVDKHSKVLVTAPSNQAVANIYRQLIDVGVLKEVIQYVGRLEGLPRDVQESSIRWKYDLKANRSQRQIHDSRLAEAILQDSRVVCCTCAGSGMAILKNSRFKYALVDEAAQAQEVLTLVPLCTGVETVCLIGDDRQLNPIVNSRLTNQLKVSLFERLRQSGVPVYLLNIQYRMHPFLASFPSRRFYENRLENGVDGVSRRLPGAGIWPDTEKPIVFYDVQGSEETKGSSRVNQLEARKVVDIVRQLTLGGATSISDIGVISPYRAQVKLLNDMLTTGQQGLGRVPVDFVRTVDGFQGQERSIIIVSTVRANKKSEQKPVGFLSEPSRVNVLLTRARCGLVVVGNRAMLERDDLWKDWLEFVCGNNLYVPWEQGANQGQGNQGQGNQGQGNQGQGNQGRGNQEQGSHGRGNQGRGNPGQRTNRGRGLNRGQMNQGRGNRFPVQRRGGTWRASNQ